MEHKVRTSKIGQQGETIARAYLENLGLTHIESNWRCALGEIDLIMQDDSTRVFVEVRLRRDTLFGEGLETVARQKQRKLIRTCKAYQQQSNYWGDIRFDVVSILLHNNQPPIIDYIECAFDAQ